MSHTATDDAPRLIKSIADEGGFDDGVADLAVTVFDNARDKGVISEDVERGEDGLFEGNETRFPTEVYPAAVYAAARIRDLPTKPDEFVTYADAAFDEDSGITADDVTNQYKAILSAVPFKVEPESPTDWVRRVCDDLGTSDDFEATAVDLAEDAIDDGLHVGKSTSGFAAAVVYAASEFADAGFEQEDVADAAGVVVMTIRNQYRDVLGLRDDTRTPGDPDSITAAVNGLCDRIDGLPSRVRADALELASYAVDEDAPFLRRTDPKGVAAGVVYVAAKDGRVDLSQSETAAVAGVSKSTVVNRVNDVRDWRHRRQLDGVDYNELKRLAGENGIDVGSTPEREYLIRRLVDEGVEYDG